MPLDPDTCYQALVARDPRFDGVFFVGVTTTGIYCRPVCRARTPGRDRCSFYTRGVEAEREGFRACFRCRPELAPGNGSVDAVPRLAQAAAMRIEAGALAEGSVDDLAKELGVTARHLRRAVQQELGVTPLALGAARRLALAKQLVQDTSLPMANVAFASGFASVRRFNAVFQARFGRAPSELRSPTRPSVPSESFVLRLDYRPPFAWSAFVRFLEARITRGVESVYEGAYRRTIRLGSRHGWLSVAPDPRHGALRVEIALSLTGALLPLVARLRRLFDLDAQPSAIAADLRRDAQLAPLVDACPGLRVPGAFDGFEATVRAILGQQVSVRAATTLSGRLAMAFGDAIATPYPELTQLAPTAERIADADPSELTSLGVVPARAATIVALARALRGGALTLDPESDGTVALERLRALKGIGDWTASYVAMRVMRRPDAFPAGDLVLQRALGVASAREAEARAETFRPWRAYAALHLWNSLAKGPSP